MWRRTCMLACAATAGASGSNGSLSSTVAPGQGVTLTPEQQNTVQVSNNLYQWSMQNECRINNLALNLDNKTGRGLVSTHTQREGSVILAVPLKTFSLTSESLLESSEHVQRAGLPSKQEVREWMMEAGIQKKPMADMMHLALGIAVERTNPNSIWQPYFDTLPHPFIAPETEEFYIRALDLIERSEYTVVKEDMARFHQFVLSNWKAADPTCQPNFNHLDWSWRTVLARQHQFPDQFVDSEKTGLSHAPAKGSKLNFVDYLDVERNTKLWDKFKRWLNDETSVGIDYELVPTLVPLLDTVAHHPNGNVCVEVRDRGDMGVCAELQAVRQIEPGEEISFTYARDSTIAFTLYRFGFIPM